MMNYIWAGLILVSFLFAIGKDTSDLYHNTYRNGIPLTATIEWPAAAPTNDPTERVTIRFTEEAWRDYFSRPKPSSQDETFEAVVVRGDGSTQLQLVAPALPFPLNEARAFHDGENKTLAATTRQQLPAPYTAAAAVPVSLNIPAVRFVKLKAINEAAVRFAQTAFEVVLSLVGGLALWLGLLKIAEDSGLVNILVRVIQPVLRPLFPSVPRESPALGLIALNVAANMLALGNAATPIGIKAMQELQKLNPTKDTATNAMVMLLAINTAGVTLLPSPSLVGIMGPRIGAVMGPIMLTTAVALAIAIVTCKLLERKEPTA